MRPSKSQRNTKAVSSEKTVTVDQRLAEMSAGSFCLMISDSSVVN